ncbi:MAG: hypothetical protein IPK19_24985 [Chloroflexi bacterium]|nr:hypothetical protein [Chloroflexota bacterium]
MEERYFTEPYTWNGGFYELAIELGQRSDQRLLAALQALWGFPDLKGVFLDRAVEPHLQEQIVLLSNCLLEGHLYGLARLPNAALIACGTVLVREDSGIDWLSFYIPMGALNRKYKTGGFPFGKADDDDNHGTWRAPLDTWMWTIGQYVFDHVGFDLALIGHEVLGEIYADNIRAMGIPPQRWVGYIWPEDGKLAYYPCTKYGSPLTFS